MEPCPAADDMGWRDEVGRTLQRVQELVLTEDEESRPYKFKYEAADLIKATLQKLQAEDQVRRPPGDAPPDVAAVTADPDGHTSSAGTPEPPPPATDSEPQPNSTGPASSALQPPTPHQEQIALLKARLGLTLLETDLLADGEKSVLEALPFLVHGWPARPLLLQEAYNALGALCCGRGNMDQALEWLHQSEELYHKQVAAAGAGTAAGAGAAGAGAGPVAGAGAAGQRAASGQDVGAAVSSDMGGDDRRRPSETAAAQQGGGASASSAGGALNSRLEMQYTTTLFYLAQVHGHARDREKSAEYCAATLGRQLQTGEFQLNDWVQNCLQLAGFYLSNNAFALGQLCLLASGAVIQQALSKLDAADAAPGPTSGAVDPSASAPPAAAAAGPSSGASSSSPVPLGPTADLATMSRVLDDDVAANVHISWGKLYLCRLAVSHEAVMEGAQVDLPYSEPSQLPGILRFPTLGLPPAERLTWGKAALARDFEGARALFNLSLPLVSAHAHACPC